MYVNSLDFRSRNNTNNSNARIDNVLDKDEIADSGRTKKVAKKSSVHEHASARIQQWKWFLPKVRL